MKPAKKSTYWQIAGKKPPPIRPTSRAWWPKDAPIHYPTNPDGSPAYKVTRGPAPADPTQTNTHSEAP